METTLLAEVQELQRRVEELSAITPRTPQFADETEGALMLDDGDVDRLLDVLDGEESMVLATPLLPLLDRDGSDEGG